MRHSTLYRAQKSPLKRAHDVDVLNEKNTGIVVAS